MKINEFGEMELSWDERSEIMSELNISVSGYVVYVDRFGSVYVNGKFYGMVRPSLVNGD